MTEIFQIFITALLVWLGFVFWIPVADELIPEIKQMGTKPKWFWVLVIIALYIVLTIILLCVWLLPGFNLPTK